MGPRIVGTTSAAIAAIAASVMAGASVPSDRGGDPGTPSAMQVEQRLAGLEVPFETNVGRFDPQVAFSARTFAGTLFVTREGVLVHSLAGRTIEPDEGATGKPYRRPLPSRGTGWTLTETLVGAKVRPTGAVPSVTKVSRFVGSDPSKWVSDVATWQRVTLGEAWPGITVELAARGSNVEKLFTVAPGADARRIGIRLRGAKRLELAADGSLVAQTGNGPITFTAPVAWQEIATERRRVEVVYAVTGDRYGFRLGAHDPAHAVVIDPLLQSTYLGGANNDDIHAVAVGATGDVYVVGRTDSTTFPGTAGGSQPSLRGGSDVFIARFDASLRTLEQATYLGGSGADDAVALRIDSSGAVVVAGSTNSPDFPGTAGAAQAAYSGGGDGFVARLDAGLTALTRATYVGGAAQDNLGTLAIDAAGNVVVAGDTDSDDLPATAGAAQASRKGLVDGFVTRLDSALTAFLRSTYLGGSAYDRAYGVAVNRAGDVFVAGYTNSKDLPGTAGGAQPSNGNATFPTSDAFIARLSGDLTVLRQATYLGGLSSMTRPWRSRSTRAATYLPPGTWDVFRDGPGNRIYGGYIRRQAQRRADAAPRHAAFAGSQRRPSCLRHRRRTGDRRCGQRLRRRVNSGLRFSVSRKRPPGNEREARRRSSPACGTPSSRGSTTRSPRSCSRPTLAAPTTTAAAALTLDPAGNVVVVGTTSSADLPARALGFQPALSGPSDGFVTKLTASLRGDDGPQAAAPTEVPLLATWLLATLAGVVAGAGGLRLFARRR